MKLKAGVKFRSKDQAMAFAAMVVNSVFENHGFECVITSANDSTHSQGSLHYMDGAFDFRTKHLPDADTKMKIIQEIRESLTDQFDVLLEGIGMANEHGHCEFDPD